MNHSQSDDSVSQSLDRKKRLKHIMDQGQELERNMSKEDPVRALDEICNYIKQSDGIICEGDVEDRAGHTTEIVMDTHVLRMNHELISKVIQQNLGFNEMVYQNAIANFVYRGGAEYDWNLLADIACSITRTVNVQSTMLGAAEPNLRAPILRQRQQRTKKQLALEKRPETVTKISRQDEGAEKVNIIHRQLAQIFKENDSRPVPFYKLIVDPNNFMNSVENAFQLSFLARDGCIAIERGEDGNPEVRLMNKNEQRIEKKESQWICSLDMKLCSEMAKFYKIKKPMLKNEQHDISHDEDEYMVKDEDDDD